MNIKFTYLGLVLYLGLFLQSCNCPTCEVCPTAAEINNKCSNPDIQFDAGAYVNPEFDLSLLVSTATQSKLKITPKENPDDANSFLIDVDLDVPTGRNITTKFTQVPHHPIAAYDGKPFLAIGFLEIIDLDNIDTNKVKSVPEASTTGTKTYSINIPKGNMPGFGSVMIYSPQSPAHGNLAGGGKPNSHMLDGIVKDPR